MIVKGLIVFFGINGKGERTAKKTNELRLIANSVIFKVEHPVNCVSK